MYSNKTKGFKCRQFGVHPSHNASPDRFGVKDEYSSIVDGNRVHVNAVFGLDAKFRGVIPAIYTKDGFAPLSVMLDSRLDILSQVENFIRSRRATYSVLSVTMLICELSAVVEVVNNVANCVFLKYRIYSPCGYNPNKGEIITREVLVNKNSALYREVNQVMLYLEPSLFNRAYFLCRRMSLI